MTIRTEEEIKLQLEEKTKEYQYFAGYCDALEWVLKKSLIGDNK